MSVVTSTQAYSLNKNYWSKLPRIELQFNNDFFFLNLLSLFRDVSKWPTKKLCSWNPYKMLHAIFLLLAGSLN